MYKPTQIQSLHTIHVHIHIHLSISNIYIHMLTYIHTLPEGIVNMYSHTFIMCTYSYNYIHDYIYMHTYVHTCIYIYVYMHSTWTNTYVYT